MNYLVTHYKNLAEQLQSRINHIQQCLYEMDSPGHGGGFTENPGRHGGGLLPPINRVNVRDTPLSGFDSQRPRHGGGFTENPYRLPTGGGFRERPNRVDGRQTLQSTGDSERPSNQYDQNDPFWSSQRGRLFLQNWDLLAAALRMPTLDRATLNAINQQGFQTLAAFRAHLQNLANTYANQYGVVMPPLPL